MLTWFKIGLALLSLARTILEMVEKSKIEEAARARLALALLDAFDGRTENAKKARDAAMAAFDAGSMSTDPDPNRRD